MFNLIYPNVCGFCGKVDENCLCEECEKELDKYLKYNEITKFNKSFEKHIYLATYEGKVRENILSYKFLDKPYMHKTFAKIILKNEKMYRIIQSYDIIGAVPIHKKRKNERGYNQSELIAKEISRNIKELKYGKILRKIKNNERQSSLSKDKRNQNVKGVYQIENSQIIKGKKVILFDDIYTTGSTVEECSKVLKANNAKEIMILTLAK